MMSWGEEHSFGDYDDAVRGESGPEKLSDILSRWLARYGDAEKVRMNYEIDRLIYESGCRPPEDS